MSFDDDMKDIQRIEYVSRVMVVARGLTQVHYLERLKRLEEDSNES